MVNDARECAERLIDDLWEALPEKPPRPRTNREVCRHRFLEITKLRRKGNSKLRGCLRFLMNTLERNLRFIDNYAKQLKREGLQDITG